MTGGRGQGNYSSEEESDTEEYKEVRDKVNPISGYIDAPRVNPLEVSSFSIYFKINEVSFNYCSDI